MHNVKLNNEKRMIIKLIHEWSVGKLAFRVCVQGNQNE